MKKLVFLAVFILLFSVATSAETLEDAVAAEMIGESEIYLPENPFGDELTAENFDIKNLLSLVAQSVTAVFYEEKASFVSLLSILIVSFLSKQLSTGLSSSAALSTARRVCAVLTAATVFLPLFSTVEETLSFSNGLSASALSFLPVFSSVSYSSGVAAATYSVSSLVFFSTELFTWVFSSLIPVLCSVFLALGFAGGIAGEGEMKKLSATVRNFTVFLLASFCFLITALPTLQSGLFSTGESFAKKGLKFVLSSVVPVGGGFLSDGLDSVFFAAGVFKKSCGSFFAVAVLLSAIGPAVKLAVTALVFRLSAAAASVFHDEPLESFLSAAFDACSVVLSFVLACAVVLSSLVSSLANIGGVYG